MICSQRSDGLGTRILCAIYAQLVAERIGCPMTVIWTPLGWPDPPHSPVLMHPRHILDLFDGLHLFVDGERGPYGDIVLHEAIVSTGLFSLFYNRDEMSGLSAEEIAQIARMGRGINYDFPRPLLAFMEADPVLGANVARVAARINWNRRVAAELEAFDRRSPLERCIAVHVRRGDILDMLMSADPAVLADGLMIQILQRFTPLGAYFTEVDRHRRGGIIVCTEDRSVVEAFVRRYGSERIVSCADRGLSDNQRAAMDLLLLSRSRKIIAPAVSFFSQCAAAIGNTALRNTAWRLEETTDEIRAMLEGTAASRAGPVTAILYAAAHVIASRKKLASARAFGSRARALDPALFDRVVVNA